MALLEDERLILRWLSEYGLLERQQLQHLLYGKSERSMNGIFRNLKRGRYITEIENGNYLALDRYCEPQQRMVTAVWVLLQFVEQIAPDAHRQADTPAQIFFLKDKTAYEIVVLHEGEDHLVRLLQPKPDMKYILVVPNMAFAASLLLPDVPCLFAVVEPSVFPAPPKITFYSV